MQEVLTKVFFENSMRDYLYALAVFLFVSSVLKIIKSLILIRIKKLIDKTKIDYDDVVFNLLTNVFKWPVIFLIAINIAVKFITINQTYKSVVYVFTLFIAIFYLVKAVNQVISYVSGKLAKKFDAEERKSDAAMSRVLAKLAKGVVGVIGILVLIQGLGFNISGLAAGLGVSSIVLAFALQSVLEDLFSSISIQFDQPFKVGDFVKVGEDSGTVKSIGLKSSRITTLDGDELVISNKELISTRIRNYRKIRKRRGRLKFGVTYNTSPEKIEKILEIVEKIISKQEHVEFTSVYLKELGDFSINFTAFYYVIKKDYSIYAKARQNINLELLKAFNKEKIEFAYPTQSVIVQKN